MRSPIANQTHYANAPSLLDKQFEALFTHKLGPATLPSKSLASEKDTDPVQALIVPHAPYDVAGPCMAWGYKELAEHKKDSDLYIIIGQAQKSTQAGTTQETFQMPYGEVRVDQDFVRELTGKNHIDINDELHAEESTIEIQLPFLQFINGIYRDRIKIVPLFVNAQTDLNALAVDIKEVLVEQGKEATFIFTSNLTSYGRDFRYVPFTENIQENLLALDKEIFESIKSFDREAFTALIDEKMIPVSGYFALQLMFYLFTPKSVLLEQNYLSGDINKNYTNTVGYASIVIR